MHHSILKEGEAIGVADAASETVRALRIHLMKKSSGDREARALKRALEVLDLAQWSFDHNTLARAQDKPFTEGLKLLESYRALGWFLLKPDEEKSSHILTTCQKTLADLLDEQKPDPDERFVLHAISVFKVVCRSANDEACRLHRGDR